MTNHHRVGSASYCPCRVLDTHTRDVGTSEKIVIIIHLFAIESAHDGAKLMLLLQ